MMTLRPILSLVLALLAACSPTPPPFHNTDLSGATFGRVLNLTDHNGQPKTLADFHGKVVVLLFGYTSCPDICPSMLTRLAEVMTALGDAALKVQVLFVTVDPERDSGERLKEFVPWFYPGFLGLRGDTAQTRAVLHEFRVVATPKPVAGAMGYVIDHSAGAYVLDPDGRLRLYVKETASVDDITADLRRLLGRG
jgi:protein SCO1/2